MFKKQLSINKYLSLVTLCILINLLESWYFGLNWQAESLAENVCDWVTSIPLVIFSFWFRFTNDYISYIKGFIIMFVMMIVYGFAYGVAFM